MASVAGRRVPSSLHDLLGESPRLGEVAVAVAFGVAVAAWVGVELAGAVAPWRLVLALLLVTDVAAGCLVNFAHSTNDFYAHRPARRWQFIAVHVHPLAIAGLLGADPVTAVVVWGYTVGSAALVNGAAGSPRQPFLGGAAAGVGALLVAASGVPAVVGLVYLLFVVKLSLAFAVDHDPVPSAPADGIGSLTHRDRAAATALLAAAFAADPLFVAASPSARSEEESRARGRAFATYVFDATVSSGGLARGVYAEAELAGVALVDPPRKRLAAAFAALWSALRFLPVSVRLGRRASRLLNTYYATVRAAAPREPHHRLVMLGVAPHRQGAGVGGRLVRDAIELVAAHPTSTGLALDTENHANAVFYEAHGFTGAGSAAIEGLRVHLFRRPS